MGAKPYQILAIFAAAAAATGCADLNLARFAPPGFIKYEDIAGDQPVNPEIEGRIAERKAAGESRTPNLSKQPQKIPTGMPADQLNAAYADLRGKRDTLNTAVEGDRAAAFDERGASVKLPGHGELPIEETAGALSRAVDRDAEAARKERAQPLQAPAADAASEQADKQADEQADKQD